MEELKINTHITYETSDGRVFEDEQLAKYWQRILTVFKDIIMLNCEFKQTNQLNNAIYVLIQNDEQLKAFNAMQGYEGFRARIFRVGYHYYDGLDDEFINVDTMLDKLQNIKMNLDAVGK